MGSEVAVDWERMGKGKGGSLVLVLKCVMENCLVVNGWWCVGLRVRV